MAQHTLKPNKWVDNFADYLYNYTIHRVNDRNMAQDLVQETFFAALKSAPNYKGNASERTWLTSILKRKIIDHYRKANSNKGKAEVRMSYVSSEETEGDWMEERVADSLQILPGKEMENAELAAALQTCISKLSAKQAQAFEMKTIIGMETEDICNELEITASNLWVIIHRARLSLVDCLKSNWF
ncbi:MAG: sigma-70 family RNA polymerase sigma factor [Flavobacteriaceae bacterium]|nr:sigma-70 family RNA polymerase sigma factor [Flavobacteriaceae bacterium]